MVTMSLSVVSFIGFNIEAVRVEGNVVRYFPPQGGKGLEAEIVPFIPRLMI